MPHSRYGRLLVPFTLAILIALGGCAGQVAKNSAPPDVTTMPAADYLIGVELHSHEYLSTRTKQIREIGP
jgi:hypothetical protein